MKTAVIVISVLFVLIVVLFFVRGFMSRSGVAAGLDNDQLTVCPDRPNCVCSEGNPGGDTYIAPIQLDASNYSDGWKVLKTTIVELGGRIQIDKSDYLAATFSSRIFGFVDDVEARLDSERGIIHIRSASRVGYSDFGINRKRIELLRQRYAGRIKA